MALSLRNYKPRTYSRNFSAYEAYSSNHRPHQKDAISVASSNKKGQIISPCGTGKTRIQASLHVLAMMEASHKNETGVFVIASHRLSLNRQLCDVIVDLAIKCGIMFDILFIGSDRGDTDKYYTTYSCLGFSPLVSRNLTTLSMDKVEAFIARAKEDNRQTLVVSTYDSIGYLANVGNINLLTGDEAQNLVREDFIKSMQVIKPNLLREYYLTATRKTRGEKGGMNDEQFFGKVLIDIKPQIMIERGEIVSPHIHIVKGSNEETNNTANIPMLVKDIIEAFSKHREQIKSDSISPDDIGAKIIVGCNGIVEMEDIYNHLDFVDFVGQFNYFAISTGGAYFNGEKVGTEKFFEHMNNLTDSEDAIIMNVDMLTEGIDLPSITGVMPFRNLGVIKLIQLLGRALRLHPKDRSRIYSGELAPSDYVNYVKPFGHLIMPENLNTLSDSREMKDIIRKIYNEYNTPIEDMVILDKYIDTTPDDLKSMIHNKVDDGKLYTLRHTITDIKSSVERDIIEDHISNMTLQDKIEYILNLI